jgi:O-antigen/teichoic acid export membrane protein
LNNPLIRPAGTFSPTITRVSRTNVASGGEGSFDASSIFVTAHKRPAFMTTALCEPHELGEFDDLIVESPHVASSRGMFARIVALAANPGLLSVVDQALVSGTSFVTTLLIGRTCSRETLGLFALAISLVALARAIQEQLVSAPYLVYAGRDRGRSLAAYTGACLLQHLALSGLALVAFGGLWFALAQGWGPAGLLPAMPVLTIALPFVLLREHVRQTAYGQLEPRAAVAVDAVAAFVQLGTIALLAWSGWLSLVGIYASMGLACAVAAGGWLYARRSAIELRFDQVRADVRRNWTLGRWALACHLVGQLAPFVMPWLLALSHGEGAAGLLAACATLAGPAGMLLAGYANYLTPRLSRTYAQQGPAGMWATLVHSAGLFTLSLGLFCALAWLWGDELVALAYGARYAGGGPIFALLASVVLVNSFGVLAGNGLWAMERASANFRADVLTMLVTVGVAACAIGPYGPVGGAVAVLAGTAAGAALRVAILMTALREVTPRVGSAHG